jgi:hypothetical protein
MFYEFPIPNTGARMLQVQISHFSEVAHTFCTYSCREACSQHSSFKHAVILTECPDYLRQTLKYGAMMLVLRAVVVIIDL